MLVGRTSLYEKDVTVMKMLFTNHILIFHLNCLIILSKNLNIYYYFFSFINDENYRRVIFNFAKAVLTDVNYVTINSAQKSVIKKCNFHKFKDPKLLN